MKRTLSLLGLVCLLAVLSLPAAAGAATLPERYILPGNAVFPEGVAYQAGTGTFYVSSTTDGTIFRGDTRVEQTEVFLAGGQDGRTTAVGLKVDQGGRLFIAGGNTGKLFVYDTANGALLAAFDNDRATTFVNDVALTDDGYAYFTDSLAPVLYRLAPTPGGGYSFETFIDFSGTPFAYQPGFNANGIVINSTNRYALIVQSNTGKLFRVDLATKVVDQVNLNGASLTAGDGLVLLGRTLYTVRNSLGLIAKVQLDRDLLNGTLVSQTGDPSFRFPTTAARAYDRLLVVNSQFNKRGPGLTPELPFTVSSVPIP